MNYLSGAKGKDGQNGKSAHELWVEEVAKGLENPHAEGEDWPKDKTTLQDFWDYLTGRDGSDGSPGTVGEPGKDVTIVKGKPNVISQYSMQEYSEFVRWSDGGVAFIVYDDQGNISPGAKVKGLPGVQDSTKVYVADEKGGFIVPKEDLPFEAEIADRFGSTTEVEYLKSTGEIVKELSAPNTYVPNRIQVRLRLISNITLDSSDENVGLTVERKIDANTDWESIPSYLGSLYQYIRAYELSDVNDPTSYTKNSRLFYSSSKNISGSSSAFVTRLVKLSPYVLSQSYLWDGADHYFNMVLESYYGEKPHANVVIQMVPIQYMPYIKNLAASGYNNTVGFLTQLTGDFAVDEDNAIDTSLLFQFNLSIKQKTEGSNNFNYYYPVPTALENIIDSKIFGISFVVTENTSNNNDNKASISIPSFVLTTPYIESTVNLTSSSHNFKSLEKIGNLKYENEAFKIVGYKTSTGAYNFPDIDITLQD